jgi:hypothetical protein
MRRLPLLALSALLGCATTTASPATSPALDVSARGLPPLPTKTVLVLSAATFLQVAPELSFNACLSSSGAGSRAAGTSCPPAPVAELAAVSTLVERGFFEAGWEPVTQAAAARLITGSHVATGLRGLLSRGQASLLEGSMLVGTASTADLFLVVSDWWTTFAARPTVEASGHKLCPLSGTLGLEAYGRTGKLVWRGQVTVQTTDTAPVSMTGTKVNPPGYACVAGESCAECGASAPVSPEAAQELLTRATGVLVHELLAHQEGAPAAK